MTSTNESLLWQIRHFVYNHFADTTFPPSVEETARQFNISTKEVGNYHKELNKRHAIFLEPQTLTIRMANPFSAVPTDFKVHANGQTYYANCAWDMLGIPVALHTDAVIDAVCTESNDLVQLEIRDGKIAQAGIPREASPWDAAEDGGLSKLRIHFPLPFAHWYDDLVFT